MNTFLKRTIAVFLSLPFLWSVLSCCAPQASAQAEVIPNDSYQMPAVNSSDDFICHTNTSTNQNTKPCQCQDLTILQAETFKKIVLLDDSDHLKAGIFLVKTETDSANFLKQAFYQYSPKTLQKSVPIYLSNRVLRL